MARQLSKAVSVVNLLGLSRGEIALARPYVDRLPGKESSLTLLEDRAATLETLDAAWTVEAREEGEAVVVRDAAFAAMLVPYAEIRSWIQVAQNAGAGGESLRVLLHRCLAPSRLTPLDGFSAAEELATGAEAHAIALADYNVDASLIAALRESGRAHRSAADALAEAEVARSSASSRREQARIDLVAQLRLLERYLRRVLPPTEIASLDTLRIRYLPRYSRAAKTSTAEPSG